MPPQAGFRIVLKLSPTWDKMAREFSDASLIILRDEMLAVSEEIAEGMLRQVAIHARPHSFTGRLADVRRRVGSWRFWHGPAFYRRGKPVKLGPELYGGVKLREQLRMVPAVMGRPVRYYASAIELGTERHTRPWGRLSRERLEAWAEVKLGSRRLARRIMSAIYRRGTPAYPYFAPAVKVTAKEAARQLEQGGKNWRARVEARFLR